MVNQLFAAAIAHQATVQRFDTEGTDKRSSAPHHRMFKVWTLLVTLTRLSYRLVRHRPNALVIGSSASAVMLFDAVISSIAAIMRVPVYIYHHSFAYLRPESIAWYHKLGMRMMRKRHHIALCEHMAQALAVRHGVDAQSIFKVSNAAYVKPTIPHVAGDGVDIRLGFLSSIQVSKGIFEFLDFVDDLQHSGCRVSALIAGVPEPAIAVRFFQRLQQSAHSQYLGPIGGLSKAKFFTDIDMLVLPSRHTHEAEPLVVIEALSHAVPVLVTKRGCLPSVWADRCAVQLVDEADFVAQARQAIASWLGSRTVRTEWSQAAARVHERLHSVALQQLDSLVNALCTG
jgi:glycosyltransferase involved in cell wall biosynthesis